MTLVPFNPKPQDASEITARPSMYRQLYHHTAGPNIKYREF